MKKPLASKDGKEREKDYFNPPRKPITTSRAMQVDVTEEAKGTSDDEGGKMQVSGILKEKKKETYKRRVHEIQVGAVQVGWKRLG